MGQEAVDSSRASVGELLADISSDLSTLMRQEMDLAKAEIRQSASRAGKGAAYWLLPRRGSALPGFVSVAAWWALGDSIGRGWSGLVVAGIWLITAAALALAGRSEV